MTVQRYRRRRRRRCRNLRTTSRTQFRTQLRPPEHGYEGPSWQWTAKLEGKTGPSKYCTIDLDLLDDNDPFRRRLLPQLRGPRRRPRLSTQLGPAAAAIAATGRAMDLDEGASARATATVDCGGRGLVPLGGLRYRPRVLI